MAKQLQFTFDGKDYTLEFTRKTVTQMERTGFVAADIQTKPMSTLPELFAGAFLAHHRTIPRETIDRIYDKLTNKEDLIGKLAEMYNDPIMTLVNDPEDSKGNIKWEANW